MNEMDGQSRDNVRARIEELKKLFPEAVNEGRLDYDTLMALLGDDFDNDSEKYQFTWKGKLSSLRLAQKRSTATLRPCQSESVDWDTTKNLYIEGDNLEVLKLLQQAYLRKVKLIYIDPPYNTGNDFVYEDNFADPIGQYRAQTGQALRANPETAGRYHSNWLSMMYPRLKIAKTLLRDDGVIFISIDDNEQHNLRKLCDEVFGEDNFVAQIVWQKRTSPDVRTAFSTGHEYIIAYCRDISLIDKALHPLPLSDDDKANFSNPDNDKNGPWVSSDFTAPGFRPNQMYSITTPSGVVVQPPKGRCWKNLEDVYQQYLREGRLWFGADGQGVPRQKTYLSERNGKIGWTWWPNSEVGHNQEATQELRNLLEEPVFDFPKPMRLLKRVIALASKDNDTILDFFSGSATTAHALMQQNAEDGGKRRFILVQMSEAVDEPSEAYKAGYKTICDIGKERIRRAGAKIRQNAGLLADGLDTGFRVFKLDSSNLKEWDDTWVPETRQTELYERFEEMLKPIKEDRRAVDVVYEVYLKYGIELTEPLAQVEIEGKTFYVVGENGYLFISIDKDLTEAIVEQAAVTYAPGTMIFARDSFADSNEIANVQYILEKHDIEFRWI